MINGYPINRAGFFGSHGWGGRIRTYGTRYQKPLPYHLATPQRWSAVSFIHRTERLPELLAAFDFCLGSLETFPLIPREGRDSQLSLVRGRKEGRAAFRLHAGLVVHSGPAHQTDGEDYTPEALGILRDAAPLGPVGG